MRVPTYQDQQTAQVIGQPKARLEGTHAALYRAGVEIQNIGSLLAQRQIIRDQADASNAFNAYAEEAITTKNELEQLEGVEARVVSDRYKDWHKDSVARIKEKYLHNPESQSMFSGMADKHYLSKIGSLAKHQADQEKAYNKSVLNRDLQNIEAEATNDPYATIETESGEVPAIEDRIKAYHQKASIIMGGAYTQDVAGDIESKMKASALSAMIAQDPSKVGPYLEKWKVDIGAKAYAQFKNTAQKEVVKKQVDAVYDTARMMDITDAEEYINKSGLPKDERRSLIGSVRQDFDRKQKEISDQQEKIVKQNDLDVLEAFYNKTLNRKDLDKLAEGQQVSKDIYKFINEKYDKEAEGENNPEIVGDIAARIELKDYPGAFKMMEDALGNRQIKGQSYITMMKSIADSQVGDAVGYINRAMQPSELEFDPYKKQKHADAIVDLSLRMSKGENPLVAAKEIVRLNRTTSQKMLSRYRDPRFLTGDRMNEVQMADAEFKTIGAYKNGLLTDAEYKREMELIQNIREALKESQRAEETDKDMESVLKGLKIGN